MPLVADGTLGGAALLFAFLATAITAVACGFGPALSARNTSVQVALREGGRGGVGSRQRLRGWLVAGEVAAATLILSGAALLGRSYAAMQDVDPGFNPQQVLTARLSRLGEAAEKSQVAFANDVVEPPVSRCLGSPRRRPRRSCRSTATPASARPSSSPIVRSRRRRASGRRPTTAR